MSLLADLFKRLEAQPEFQGARPATTQPDQLDTHPEAPVAHVLTREVEEPDQPDYPSAASDRRAAWRITLDGKTICRMVGDPITYSDALAAARCRWPEANILEAP
ncbi:hypothetical protein [Stutzerimonas frequens]|uniref:hypothetical protein n=1 Tax=Stutzerimonas frequens TaxID=2968969 RepID=UPI0012E2AD80|nr:hypothetical protein [Stutzerimonas frequens]MUT71508.1 hypothetical protein [Stutzerimonas frequens]